jgi:hypothetical protein
VETLQRVRSDARDKALNALRQLADEVHAGRFPGLYLVITGTPAFYDGPQGVARLAPLAQRLATDFPAEARFDNPGRCRSGSPGSPSTHSSNSVPGYATCSPTAPPPGTGCSPAEWRAGIQDATDRLCLPDVDPKALTGLKFNSALPERLALATLATRLADLPAALDVLRTPARLVIG